MPKELSTYFREQLIPLSNAITPNHFEAETLLLVTELPFSSLLLDKLNVVKVIENDPSLFFEDPMFMIYATAVINNELANFEYLPHITSLELAFSLVEIARVLGVETYELPEFSLANKEYIRHILIEEGYSEVVPPFDVVGIGKIIGTI